MTTLPYGSWPSPISAAQVARAGVRLQDVALGESGRRLWWAEGRPDEAGRTAIVRRDGHGVAQEVLPRDFNARTRVHEYGGGGWAVAGDGVVAARWDDQRLCSSGRSKRSCRSTGRPSVSPHREFRCCRSSR